MARPGFSPRVQPVYQGAGIFVYIYAVSGNVYVFPGLSIDAFSIDTV
jgi:hypothetical protein